MSYSHKLNFLTFSKSSRAASGLASRMQLGLRGKMISILVLASIAVGVLTIWTLNTVGGRIADDLGASVAERYVLWHRELVLGTVNRELALAKKMAESVVIQRWAVSEDDPQAAEDARREFESFKDGFSAKSFFVGLEKSKHFFYTDKKSEHVELKIVDKLNPNDEDDIWFFSTIGSPEPFNLNIDHNVQLGVTNLWVNYAMRSGKETLGVVGTGIKLTNFIETFLASDVRGISTMLLDGNGAIQAHRDETIIDRNTMAKAKEAQSGIWGLLGSQKDRDHLRNLMEKLKSEENNSESIFLNINNKRLLLAISYLKPLGWFSVAMMDTSSVIDQKEMITFGAILGGAIVLMIAMFVIGQNIVILRPLLKLKDGAERVARGDYDVRLPVGQKDEIGILTGTFNDMSSTISEYMQTLEAKVVKRTSELSKEVAERKNAERRLQYTQYTVDHAAEAVFWVRPEDGGLDYINEAARANLGYTSEELSTMCISQIDVDFTAEKFPKLIEMLTEQRFATFESRQQKKNGDIFDVEVRAYLTEFEGREILIANSMDITERKRVEEEIKDARDKAEEATKAKATFLATMSHEIRTPMGGVIGMVDLLQQSKMTDDQRQMINTVGDSAQSLLTIINDILDFSKIEAGKLNLEEIPISIRDVVEGAGEALAVTARNKNIGLSVYVDPDLPDALIGDQVRLRQIFFNFGTNAIKFTEKGKVLIRADMVPSSTKEKVAVRFQVIDEGIGIPEEAQKTLFQAFSQVDASTTRRFGGTGLGLTICQRLTEIMNGEIGVESVLGEGSTFSATVALPIAKEHTFESDGHDLTGLNILFAHHDDDLRGLTPRYLKHWNATVTTTAEIDLITQMALDAVKEGLPFDVICLGSSWPTSKQVETIELLQAEKKLDKMRYVVACRDRVKANRKELDNTVYVDAGPLRRAAFIKSVAVAAGRASPDIEYDDSETNLDAVKAPTVAEAEAMGQLILLAEDNLTNQDVIRRQLTMLGYAVEIANDGKEALELLESKSFAILLTDCHMPNMDGFELTETIRKLEKGEGRHFPIIAVTASVMKDETDRCIAAGMDDYLAKPLEMKKLKKKLQEWMPATNGVAAEGAEEPDAEDTTNDVTAQKDGDKGNGAIDPSALKNIFGDDEATIKEILEEFIEPTQNIAKEILDAYADREAQAIGAAAHKLKSSSRSVGAHELADLCSNMEEAGKAGNWDKLDSIFPDFDPVMNAVISYIDAL